MDAKKDPDISVNGIGGRIRQLRGSDTQAQFAGRTGIPKNTLGRYERGEMVPGGDAIALICKRTGADPTWLLLGPAPAGGMAGGESLSGHEPDQSSGPGGQGAESVTQMLAALLTEIRAVRDELRGLSIQLDPTEKARKTGQLVSVIGLAQCGIKGWEMRSSTGLHAEAPADIAGVEGSFGVIAVGDSMRPAGIEPGFLCLCSPETEPRFGDVVYVERKDHYAAIKLYGGEVTENGTAFLQLQGCLPPDPDDPAKPQKPYVDNIAKSAISRVVTVVYVKRRL